MQRAGEEKVIGTGQVLLNYSPPLPLPPSPLPCQSPEVIAMPPRWKNFSLLESLSRCSKAAVALTLTASAIVLGSKPTQAEGSRTLYPAGATGSRASLEWRGPAAGRWISLLEFRTLLKVYARAGEYIFLGSSTVGVGQGDIRVYNPGLVTGAVGSETIPANPSFSCQAQRTNTGTANQGQILTRAQELAGPNPAAGGYVPCFYQAPVSGVYDVAMFGPNGPNNATIGVLTGTIDPVQTDANQGTSVAAWDVTVRSDLTSTIDLTGRLFTYYVALFTGANNRPINSSLYTLTTDGFLYQTDLNGLDPNGFVLFGNRVGFLQPDGRTPLNHDIVATGTGDPANLLTTPAGGVTAALPEFPIFFNRPDPEAQSAIDPPPPGIPGATDRPSIPLIPPIPQLTNFSFTGTVADNTSTFNTGGTFNYTANIEHTYQIVISRDGVNFDPTNPNNRVLRGILPAGTQTVAWDGTDNSGNPFPVGRNYQARMRLETGNYHFPLLDIENSPNGGPQLTLLNAPGGACPFFTSCTAAFYDDRGYRTSSGTPVGTPNQPLQNAPPLPYSGAPGPFGPFDSRNNQRIFAGFGDTKGLDVWTLFPGNELTTPLNIVRANPDLSIQKRSVGNFLVGQQGTYTLRVRNAPRGGPTTEPITVTDTIPTGLTFVSATGTNWTCSAAGQSLTCTYNGPALAPGEFAPTITLRVNVTSAAAPGVTNTATVATAGDTNDRNNTDSNNTPVLLPPAINKSVRFLRDNDNSGTATVGDDIQYSIIVQNPSNNSVPLTNVVISDLVSNQLQVLRDSANPISVNSGFSLASTLPSTSFNGTNSLVTFTQPGTLAPGAAVTLTFNARVLPGAASPVSNQASVDFQGNNGTPILSDASDTNNPTQPGSGVNPGNPSPIESGGNVNQPNDSNTDPTIINLVSPVSPTGTKSVRLVTDTDNSGSLTTGDVLEYTVTYTNSTSSSIGNFLVTDPIDSSKLSFVSGSYSFSVVNGSATTNGTTTVTANPNYNGTTDTNLTNPTTRGELGAGGGKVIIKFRAIVIAPAGTQVSNQASAASNGLINPSLTDALQNPGDLPQGLDDGINQGNLPATGDDDPTLLTPVGASPSSLRLVKRITNVTRGGVPISGIDFSSYVDDPADPNDNQQIWSQFLPVGVSRVSSEFSLQSGDEVEYTVYYISDGGSAVTDVKVCDAIPAGTTFFADSFGSGSGILLNQAGTDTPQTNASDADQGTFFSPLNPVTAPCTDTNNPNGSVFLQLGNVPNTSPSNVGFIRFRVRIN